VSDPSIQPQIQQHNLRAAAVWDSAGANYERVSQTIADAIEHCVIRLAPQPQEEVLDVATGTGFAARRVAARGARVTGVDLGADLIEAAKTLSAETRQHIDFRLGDAESLPFENKSFDALISTFGVMFVNRPEAAAVELSRLCRPGGRLALATWLPDSAIAGLFKVMKPYMATQPTPPPSPFEWGDRDRLQQLLGASFDLHFENGISVMRERSGEAVWDLFLSSYGPTKALAATLEPERREQLKQDVIAYHDGFKTDLGIAMPREYLVTVGWRK
jgi:ubiquinone/menaquinone biosynthesis C-methylase UbiE